MLTRGQESLLRSMRTRQGRRKGEHCICEGLRCCREMLGLRPELAELILLSEEFDLVSIDLPKLPVEAVKLPESEFSRISSTVNPQGILVMARRPEAPAEPPGADEHFAFALDRVSDPGNLGTILRTAVAAGLKSVWMTKGCADPYSEKSIRSAMGAQFGLSLRMSESADELCRDLKRHGFGRIYRTVPEGGGNLFSEPSLFTSSAIVMGSESQGVAELDGATPLSIPMPGPEESLNVAQAAAIILFEHVRRLSTLQGKPL